MEIDSFWTFVLNDSHAPWPCFCHIWCPVITMTTNMTQRKTPCFKPLQNCLCKYLPLYSLHKNEVFKNLFYTAIQDIPESMGKLFLVREIGHLVHNDGIFLDLIEMISFSLHWQTTSIKIFWISLEAYNAFLGTCFRWLASSSSVSARKWTSLVKLPKF